MFPAASLLYLYTESPLHAGIGRQEDQAADLPIQREETTGYPIVQASTLKGVFRARAAAQRPAEEVACAFGPEPEAEEEFAGAIVFSDARPLLFPVRSLMGIFAWITSPEVFARFRRDVETYLGEPPAPPDIPAPPDGTAWISPDSWVQTEKGLVVLEEISFQAREQKGVRGLGGWLAHTVFPQDETFTYWREKIATDLVVLPEDAFRYFVVHATEVVARIRINRETGAAAEGALWTEEYLPTDMVLYAPVGAQMPVHPAGALQSAEDALRWFQGLELGALQIGGSRTLGRGLVRVRWAHEEEA